MFSGLYAGKRSARGSGGKTYYVPADMKYPDWFKTFVEGGSKDALTLAETGVILNSTKAEGEGFGVQKICELDRSKLQDIYPSLPSVDVVLTDERILHIQDHHPGDWDIFEKYVVSAIKDPDIMLKDEKNLATIMYIRAVEGTNLNVIIRLVLATDQGKNHSIMTAYCLGEKSLKRLMKKNGLIYKRG